MIKLNIKGDVDESARFQHERNIENKIHEIYTFSQIKEKWFREKVGLKLPNGLPSYDTIRRTLENNLHWCLDVIFKEDEYPILDKNTAENIAIIRRIIYNKIKMQLKPKEQLCFGSRSYMYDDYRLKIMFSHI